MKLKLIFSDKIADLKELNNFGETNILQRPLLDYPPILNYDEANKHINKSHRSNMTEKSNIRSHRSEISVKFTNSIV